jgi:hypothetical protein
MAGEYSLSGGNILVSGETMETTAQPQPEKTLDQDSLFLASLVFRDVHRTVTGVHGIVAALLQYALIGASITNTLIGLTVPIASAEN